MSDNNGFYTRQLEIFQALKAPLDKSKIRKRKGPGGMELEYLAGHDIMQAMNEVFGPFWSREIKRLNSTVEKTPDGKHLAEAAASVLVVVTLGLDPNYKQITVSHEDVGHCQAKNRGRLDSISMAEKGAITDAFKRAVRCLGPRFGLTLYFAEDERGDDVYFDLTETIERYKPNDKKSLAATVYEEALKVYKDKNKLIRVWKDVGYEWGKGSPTEDQVLEFAQRCNNL